MKKTDSPQKILVIDDDERLHDRVREFLQTNGYEYGKLTGGANVLEALELFRPDIVLLDVMMPGEDGFSVLRTIRKTSDLPVIMLTARGEDADRITGLDLGADDYLAKPFNPQELLARIRAVLRRSETKNASFAVGQGAENGEEASAVDVAFSSGTVRIGSYTLDTKRQTLSYGKNTTSLSTAELCLLHAFMTRAGTVLSREQLMILAFGSDEHSTARSIDVHISRLRALLRDLGEPASRIRTVWGSGYCWIEE